MWFRNKGLMGRMQNLQALASIRGIHVVQKLILKTGIFGRVIRCAEALKSRVVCLFCNVDGSVHTVNCEQNREEKFSIPPFLPSNVNVPK